MENVPDALLTRAPALAPASCHGSLRGTCAKFKSIIDSEEFGAVRLSDGSAESAIVVCFASSREREGQIRALNDGQWRQIPRIARGDEFRVVARCPGKDSLLSICNSLNTASTEYGIPNGERSTLPRHIEQRHHSAVCHYGECTVLAGGFNQDNRDYLLSAEIFDPEVGEWTMLPSMPHHAFWAVAGVIDRKMYVVGGRNRGEFLRHLQVYDIATENWELGVPLPKSLDGLSGAVANKKLHVAGWSIESDIYSCFIFDIGRQAWIESAPICELGLYEGMFCRAFEHDGRLSVLFYPGYELGDFDLCPPPALHQLEDKGEWTEMLLREFPDAMHLSMREMSEVCSIVLG